MRSRIDPPQRHQAGRRAVQRDGVVGLLKVHKNPQTNIRRQTSATADGLAPPAIDSYAEFMSLFSKKVAESTRPGQRQDIEEGDNTFHCVGRSEGICGVIISDHQYPSLVAHQLLSKIVDEFLTKHPRSTWATGEPKLALPELKEYLTKYQDPQQADSILKIQKELDETKIVLHKTIQSVLERGEKIDDLVAKSDGLSSQSKMFYQQAKKQNSCCVVM
ncbi:synaptobrevin [Colletotrichum karsti]|uniref:Synaptobrevin homolog YKT6 n=1 Tax=Colletotrichum karsti TaxID=1095194 RepID=A0A9P6LQP2_9PEZI|nr:synaptobrevin [Colletotrichum karsti]KAF9881911.1 synaptobrevin [Colletotrichum karsti]